METGADRASRNDAAMPESQRHGTAVGRPGKMLVDTFVAMAG